ncbi:unnamed protein product [Staurois parvus]|uniref:Uncharacterized protein n=1 Tax=Staurois parvus TaxID=386267 RepID=A0ABN9B0C5_9NEOB|nr:unnamed protein product [Staurois parvus]
MGPPGNRGSWGPCDLAQTQKSLLKRGGYCSEMRQLQRHSWLVEKGAPEITLHGQGRTENS